MSAVNLCERCDSLMLGKAVAVIGIEENPSAPYKRVEICPPCMSDLNDFLHAGPTREKHVYRAPYISPESTPQTPRELY